VPSETPVLGSPPTPSAVAVGRRWSTRRVVLCVTAAFLLVLGAGGLYLYLGCQAAARRFSQHVEEVVSAAEADDRLGNPDDDAGPLYREALALYVPCPVKLNEASDEQISAYMAANRGCLEKLREAAGRPRCLLGPPLSAGIIKSDPDRVDLVPLLVFQKFMILERAQQGRAEGAIDLLPVIMAFARHAAWDGDVMEDQTLVEKIAAKAYAQVLSGSKVDVAALKRALGHLARHRASRCSPAVAARRIGVRQMILWDALNRLGSEAASTPDGPRGLRRRADDLWIRYSGAMLKVARASESFHQEVTAVLDRADPYPAALDAIPELSGRRRRDLPEGVVLGFDSSVAPYHKMAKADAEGLAYLEMLRVLMLCRLYRLSWGDFPDSLGDLTLKLPEEAKGRFGDPFTGRSLGYTRTDKGCRVWSAGPDRTDDGGTVPQQQAGKSLTPSSPRRRSRQDPSDLVLELSD